MMEKIRAKSAQKPFYVLVSGTDTKEGLAHDSWKGGQKGAAFQ